jgi:hypothetical protein
MPARACPGSRSGPFVHARSAGATMPKRWPGAISVRSNTEGTVSVIIGHVDRGEVSAGRAPLGDGVSKGAKGNGVVSNLISVGKVGLSGLKTIGGGPPPLGNGGPLVLSRDYWFTTSNATSSAGSMSCSYSPVARPNSRVLAIVSTIAPGALAVPMYARFLASS